MKPGCFVLPPLLISLLGHQSNAGPSKPNQQRNLGPNGDPFGFHGTPGGCSGQGCNGGLRRPYGRSNGPSDEAGRFSGGGNFGVTEGLTSEVNYDGYVAGDYGGSGRGRSGASENHGGNLGRANPGGDGGLLDGMGMRSSLWGGGRSTDTGFGGGGGSPSGRYGDSTGFVGSSFGAGLRGDSSGLGTGVLRPGGAGGVSDLSGHRTLGGALGGSPYIGAGPSDNIQPGGRPGSGDLISSSSPSVREDGGYGIMAGSRSPESEGSGTGSSGDGVHLGRLLSNPSPNSPETYSSGSPGGVGLPTGSVSLGGGSGAEAGGLEGGVGSRIGGLGTGLRRFEGVRNSLGIGGGAEEGFLGRLRARIRASAHALTAARASARARAKARARARALAYKRLRARLRAALHSGLSIGGGIEAGLDKAVEFTGAGVLGGRTGLEGEGATGAGLAANGGPGASATAGSTFYSGTVGYGGSYGGGYGGAYEFYSE